ncbi:MAG: hypothetical protein OEW19_07045 [Acidobacteriota bacterium]|nr:hypothetical protein [Acidobacteriota bacterium]
MSPSPPLTPVRPPWWPFPLLVILVVAGLWALDTRQPAPWPDAATPWFTQLRALAPPTWVVDRLNARAALTPDLPLGSMLVVLGVAACTLVTLLAIGVRGPVALAVALGLASTRSVWSTVSPGQDALPVAVVACAVVAVAWPAARRLAASAAALGVLLVSPTASWLAAPAFAALPMSRRRRWSSAAALIAVGLGLQVALLRQVWGGIACLVSSEWPMAVGEVLRPGSSADASPWLAVRQALAVLDGDVHAFGLCVAALGLARRSERTGPLRLATAIAMALAGLAVATGALPPSHAAALLLPWWAAWFGWGLAALIGDTSGRARPLATALGVVLALATPVLRHATVVPDPWTAGMPSVAQAVAGTWRDGFVASEDEVLTRRLRLVGATTVPADAGTLDRCVASGRPVHALGATVPRVEHLGYRIVERPLGAPLATVLHDLRPDQLVALALSPSALAWAGPPGMAALGRLALVPPYVQSTPAVALVARTDRGGTVRTGREGADLSLSAAEVVAGRRLFAPLSVSAHQGAVSVDSAPDRLAAGQHAVLAVFDRAHSAALRAVGAPGPGLLMPLTRQADWRHVDVTGAAACVPASRLWTPVPLPGRRLSVPAAGASSAHPVLLYLASAAKPTVGVAGLGSFSRWPAWSVELFDTHAAADSSRLQALETQDEVPTAVRPRARWVARVMVAPRGPWDADRVAVSAGTPPESWVVRIAAEGRRRATSAVCSMAAGDRLLQGQYGPMDDDTARELTVTAVDGWHAAESLHGQVSQWTARPVATAAFRVDTSMPLTLAMDATGASTATGDQAITVRLNDRVLRTDWKGPGRIAVPADAVRAGENTLLLEVGQVTQPDGDTRALGILVLQLRVIRP